MRFLSERYAEPHDNGTFTWLHFIEGDACEEREKQHARGKTPQQRHGAKQSENQNG